MVKNYITRLITAAICVVMISSIANAQEKFQALNANSSTAVRGASVDGVSGVLPLEDASRAACDTFNLTAYGTTWSIQHYYVGSPNWGSVNGHNSYGDKAKAQYFANTNANTYCFGARFAFSRATALITTKTVTFNVWNVSAGKPGTVLGSLTVPMSQLISDVSGGYFTDIHFTTPINTSGQPFFIGVDFSNLTLGDSLGLQSNLHGQTVPSAVFEKQSDDLWYQYNTAGSFALNISLAAFPFMTNVLPDANYTQSTTNTCSGYPVTFDASSSVQTQLLWRFQGGTPTTSTSINPTVTWATAGTYNVKLFVLGGSCNSIDSLKSTITIIQSPNPAATAVPATICQGQSTTLTASNGTTYNWAGFTAGQNPVVATPAASTTYTVSVTGSNGCSATQAVPVAVTLVPSVTVNSPSICAGQTATLTALGAVSYSWSGGLGTGNPITASPASTTTYTVSGTTSGCTGTTTSVVTVNTVPNVTVNSPSICAGTSATLTANGGTTYTWTGGLTGNPATATPGTTTTYTVSGTTTGCTGTATSIVTVIPIPNVTVNSPSICSGGTATLTANGATTYNWSDGLGTGNPMTASPSSTTTYTVTGTTSGCSATATSIVTVGSSLSISVNSPAICLGETATLTANGATTYSWSGGLGTGNPMATNPSVTTTYTVTGTTVGCSGTSTSVVTVNAIPNVTVNSPSICAGSSATLTANGGTTYTWTGGLTGNPATATPATTTTYTVSGTTSGCTGTTTSVVTVIALPNITVNSPSICEGSSATLTANGGTTYTWTGGLTGNPATATPATTTTYTVSGTMSGCTGTTTSVVTVIAIPNVTVNSPSICAGSSATLTANGGTTYAWTGGLTGNPATASPGTTTTYTVSGTTSGCTGTAQSVVTVIPIPPTPVITDIGGVLSSSSATGNQWYLNGAIIPGETNQTCNATASGNYSVIVTINGCSSAVSNIIFMVGIEERSNSSISIYPNPTRGSITVDLGSATTESEIQLFNLLGESLMKVNSSGQQKTTIDLNTLADGVYCVRIFYAGKIYNTRVVKQD
ncbi:MAG: T9SS type A sorting domain-containing protein [Bacteroidota bacterium]